MPEPMHVGGRKSREQMSIWDATRESMKEVLDTMNDPNASPQARREAAKTIEEFRRVEAEAAELESLEGDDR